MLIGLDHGAARDGAYDTRCVIQRAAVVGAGGGVFGVNAAVGYRSYRGTERRVLLVFVGAPISAARHVRALPHGRVIPPVAAVVHGVALRVALHVCRRGTVCVDLGRIGMRGEGGVVQLVYHRGVMHRVLADRHGRILYQVDRAVVCDIITLSDRVRAAHVAVVDTVGAVDIAGVDQRDMSAVIEHRVAARGFDGHVREPGDGGLKVHYDRGVAVHVLLVLKGHAGNAHGTAVHVADDRGVIRNARVAHGVRRDPAAACRIDHCKRAAVVYYGRHALICRCRRCRAGDIIPCAAVKIEGEGALVD